MVFTCRLVAGILLSNLLIVHSYVARDEVSFFVFSETTNDTELNDDNLYTLDPSKPIIFLIHGWEGDSNNSWIATLTDLYVPEHEVITVDWSEPADLFYPESVVDVKCVGGYVGELIADLYANYSANLSAIHLVGHSLGAHVAGFAGKTVQNRTGSSLGRITGLDPAGPLYLFADPTSRLAETDADLVVALHTDGGVLGYLGEVGDIDFYANGGTPNQPGCYDVLSTSCSHERSHDYFIEAVRNPEGFVSTECDLYLAYLLGACSGNRQITLGGSLTIEDAGKYYFTTNSESPYSKE